jgi:hypothetical protein
MGREESGLSCCRLGLLPRNSSPVERAGPCYNMGARGLQVGGANRVGPGDSPRPAAKNSSLILDRNVLAPLFFRWNGSYLLRYRSPQRDDCI